MGQGFNGTKKVIDVPANGTLRDILATGPLTYFEIVESQITAAGAPNVPQGITYSLPNDDFAQLHEAIPGEVVQIGDRAARHGSKGGGSMLGNGPNVIVGIGATAATTIAKVQSLTSTPTSVEVTQWYE